MQTSFLPDEPMDEAEAPETPASKPAKKAPSKKSSPKAAKKTPKKQATKKKVVGKASGAKNDKVDHRTRATRTFPNCSFEDAISLATAIQKYAAGEPIRRVTLFDHLKKSPESSASRSLVTNSGKYGLTKGSYKSELIELTDDGKVASSDELPSKDVAAAQVKLGIQHIEPFRLLYERFVNNKLPSRAVLIDTLAEAGVAESLREEAVDTFVVNAKFVGVLKALSGAERLITVAHLLESLPAVAGGASGGSSGGSSANSNPSTTKPSDVNWDKTCFYVTPIGSEGSEFRQHSDLFLSSIVEPALEPFGLKVIRADMIEKPGFITKQIIQYLLKSRLVIADLSFHNPNVFYELAIRHAAQLPTVQVTRSQDVIPFDVNPSRTIHIDCTGIYTLVPQLETYKSQIAAQVRSALDDPTSADNPISIFWPTMKIQL